MRALLLLFLILQTSSIAEAQLCSKYKSADRNNRLIVDDHRSDSIDIIATHIDAEISAINSANISANTSLKIVGRCSDIYDIKFDLEGLVVDSVIGPNVVSFSYNGRQIHVIFGQPLSQTEETQVDVFYHGEPIKDATGWGGFYFQGGFVWNMGVGFGADPHSFGRTWFPCFDNFIEKSTFEFFITTESTKKAACNGQFINAVDNGNNTKTYHWKLDQPVSSYLACVAIGSYEVLNFSAQGQAQNIPIQLFARAVDTADLKASFVHLPNAIQIFDQAYGPYRFDKVGYSLVPFNAGAMEHATNITYPIYAADGSLNNESLMAHELAHMWWGDNITCQTDGDMWLNEGWASFSEFLFEESVYGREAYESAMMADLKYMLQFGHHKEQGYRAVSGQPHEYVYGDHVYKKGALVAHNLRGYLGDSIFFETINAFMEQYKYSAVSSDSMERFFTIYSGQNLETFFRDWVFTGGYNVVVLDSFKSSSTSNGHQVDLFLQQKLKGRVDFHEDVPVYYRIFDYAGNTEDGIVYMNDSLMHATVTSQIEPEFVLLYPKNELAQARTRDQKIIAETGSLVLKNMFWNINVTSVSDTALVIFDHIWSSPDPIKKWKEKAFKMSSYHYWKIHGIGLENLQMSGEFKYDGKTTSSNSGYLDMDLLSNSEDSLVLLYRESARDDWNIYPYYIKDQLGNSSDAFGLIKLSQIHSGEYVLANINHDVLGTKELRNTEINVYPNPANDGVTIETIGLKSAILLIYDMNGAIVDRQSLVNGRVKVDLSSLKKGNYLAKIEQDGILLGTRIIVKE